MTLRTQLVVLQAIIVLAVVVTAVVVSLAAQNAQIREASQERMTAVARSVATLPTILDAYDTAHPERIIQPIAELIRDASSVTYIVVTDEHGIRYSHPNPEHIGQMVSTDPSVALSGQTYSGTQTGTLGESWRVKVPVHAEDGAILGQVSVGILESTLREDFLSDASSLALVLGAAAVVGVIAAAGVARLVRRRIFDLEPEEIRSLLETREATLHGIREGLVAFDEEGRVTICNDAAVRLLGLAAPEHLVGSRGEDAFGDDLMEFVEIARDHEADPQRLILAGERVLFARATPVQLHGRRVGTAVILMDRTEVDDALRRLAGAQSLAEGLRAQQHEFANTLHTIGGLIDLGEADAARRVVDRAASGGAITSVDAHVGIQDVELSALLLAKRAQARERGFDFEVSPESAIAEDVVAGADLVTVVGNLIDNSFDASPHGGRIELDIRATDETVRITIDDAGPGVDADETERIFDLGYSTKDGQRTRGYGLTLVWRVCARLGGSSHVEASPLGGARFVVSLPVRERSRT